MTNSQERLLDRLKRLYGGKNPIKHWTLPEITDQLLIAAKTPNLSFLKLEGDFESRYVGDALVGAGFRITVEPETSFTINW